LFSSCRDDEEPPKDGIAAPSISPATADEPAKPDIAPRVTRASVKKIPQTRNLRRSKKAKETNISLEAHASTVSPDDVSNSLSLIFCNILAFRTKRRVDLGLLCIHAS
jgi:hypothetical protein